jgi:phosphatidylglycerophosphatase A
LTNETLVETVEELSTLVQQTEEKPVEQSTENLESIANVLVNVASFVNESDIEINDTVRDQFLVAGYLTVYIHTGCGRCCRSIKHSYSMDPSQYHGERQLTVIAQ